MSDEEIKFGLGGDEGFGVSKEELDQLEEEFCILRGPLKKVDFF